MTTDLRSLVTCTQKLLDHLPLHQSTDRTLCPEALALYRTAEADRACCGNRQVEVTEISPESVGFYSGLVCARTASFVLPCWH